MCARASSRDGGASACGQHDRAEVAASLWVAISSRRSPLSTAQRPRRKSVASARRAPGTGAARLNSRSSISPPRPLPSAGNAPTGGEQRMQTPAASARRRGADAQQVGPALGDVHGDHRAVFVHRFGMILGQLAQPRMQRQQAGAQRLHAADKFAGPAATGSSLTAAAAGGCGSGTPSSAATMATRQSAVQHGVRRPVATVGCVISFRVGFDRIPSGAEIGKQSVQVVRQAPALAPGDAHRTGCHWLPVRKPPGASMTPAPPSRRHGRHREAGIGGGLQAGHA